MRKFKDLPELQNVEPEVEFLVSQAEITKRVKLDVCFYYLAGRVLTEFMPSFLDRLELLEREVFGVTDGPVIFNFPDFSSVENLQFNGSARRSLNVILVTPDEGGQAGSVFYELAVLVSPGMTFNSQFQFQVVGNPEGADGFTFCVQNSPNGVFALGEQGGSLGYAPTITNSLAVEFDTYQGGNDESSNAASILRDGNIDSLVSVSSGLPNLSGGQILNCWVDYASEELNVYLSENPLKPDIPLIVYAINLLGVVGDKFYVGFTAGTGGLHNAHQIRSWSFSSTN